MRYGESPNDEKSPTDGQQPEKRKNGKTRAQIMTSGTASIPGRCAERLPMG
jgi:hypothetical protein